MLNTSENIGPFDPHPHGIHAPHVSPDSLLFRCRERLPHGAASRANDLAALVEAGVRELHDGTVGLVAAIRGARAWQDMRAGFRPWTDADLADLALRAPRALVGYVALLARAIGYRLVPVAPAAVTLHAAIAQFDTAGATLRASVVADIADGRLDEIASAREMVAAAQRRLAELASAVEAAA